MTRQVPFYKHSINEEDIAAVAEAMRGPILTTGKTVHEFERRLAGYTGNEHVVGLMSGTHALELALEVLGVGRGDEVITTPMTFVATSNTIVKAGARPVFVDVEKDTGNIDGALVEAAITEKTRAVMVVHLYGLMCDMRRLRRIADARGLLLIEDSAHCLEGARDDVRPGNLGHAACFSFYATKNITSGEGGALSVHNEEQAALAARLAMHGMSKSAEKRFEGGYSHWDVDRVGGKANMSNIQAAMLMHQLERVESQWRRREQICRAYEEGFSRSKGVEFPKVLPGCKSGRHLFTIWVDPARRDGILAELQARGIGVTVNYRAVHLLDYYRRTYGCDRGAFPVAERIGDSTISLPMYPAMSDDDVGYVIEQVRHVCGAQCSAGMSGADRDPVEH